MSNTKLVGVSYEMDATAPLVMLKAAGPDAESLVQQARSRGGVPVISDPALVNQLYRVPIDAPIGRELFPVMALLLAHVLRIDQERAEAINK